MLNDERCAACPLLICDPLNRLCSQTPEFKLELTRRQKANERSLANLRLGPAARWAQVRKAKQAKNLAAVNEKRKFVAGLSFKKYDARCNPYLRVS